MPKPTGYKANRKSFAQRRREAQERVWRNADIPPAWELELCDKEELRKLLEKDWKITLDHQM